MTEPDNVTGRRLRYALLALATVPLGCFAIYALAMWYLADQERASIERRDAPLLALEQAYRSELQDIQDLSQGIAAHVRDCPGAPAPSLAELASAGVVTTSHKNLMKKCSIRYVPVSAASRPYDTILEQSTQHGKRTYYLMDGQVEHVTPVISPGGRFELERRIGIVGRPESITVRVHAGQGLGAGHLLGTIPCQGDPHDPLGGIGGHWNDAGEYLLVTEGNRRSRSIQVWSVKAEGLSKLQLPDEISPEQLLDSADRDQAGTWELRSMVARWVGPRTLDVKCAVQRALEDKGSVVAGCRFSVEIDDAGKTKVTRRVAEHSSRVPAP